jgi:hypothetical protein
MTNLLRLAALALFPLLCACSHPRYYVSAEQALATEGFFASQGHFAVYYPSEIALDFPGYVVGIELSERTAQLRDGDLVVTVPTHSGSTIERLAIELRDGLPQPDAVTRSSWGRGQVPVISQVLRYTGNPLGVGNCALHSLYQSAGSELMDFCDGERRPRIGEWATYQTAFTDSWGAVEVLAKALRKDAASGQYTHLVVAMMGWRTTQEEAIRNFNSLVRTTGMAARGEFRPLFVGITWVGPWGGRWLDPVNEAVSYPEIAELADTLGLTWLGVITEEAVLPLSDKLPVSFLTHSFGSRAAVTAVCVGPVIRRGQAAPPQAPVTGSIDRLIGFQAALSLQRFTDRRHYIYEDVRFPDHCPRARSIVVTTSRHDSAVRTIIWADLAGNYRYFRWFCRRKSGTIVSCAAVSESGAIEGEYDETMRVLYLDASKVIRYTAPGTDGNAHSDIFRPPAGQLIWNLISKRPPAALKPGARH